MPAVPEGRNTACVAVNLTCLMLKLDTDMIMVGLLQISSGRSQREKIAFCLGDRASFPVLSLVTRKKAKSRLTN